MCISKSNTNVIHTLRKIYLCSVSIKFNVQLKKIIILNKGFFYLLADKMPKPKNKSLPSKNILNYFLPDQGVKEIRQKYSLKCDILASGLIAGEIIAQRDPETSSNLYEATPNTLHVATDASFASQLNAGDPNDKIVVQKNLETTSGLGEQLP